MPVSVKRSNVRYSETSLARVGVELINRSSVSLRCESCGQVWSPNLRRGGAMPRGWWRCPNACNAPVSSPSMDQTAPRCD